MVLSHSRLLGGLVVWCRRLPLTMLTLPTVIKFAIFEGCVLPRLTMSMTRHPCLGLNSQSPQYPMQHLYITNLHLHVHVASPTGFPLLGTKIQTKTEGRYLDDVKIKMLYTQFEWSGKDQRASTPQVFQWRYMLKLC